MPSVSSRYASPDPSFRQPSGIAEDELRGPVVLMVSGGADSTALLVMAASSALDIGDGRGKARVARERLHVLHVNHQLRGIDAQEDEEFVCELSARYGIPCTVRRVDVAALAAKTPEGNVENVGREVRYAAANELANALCQKAGLPRTAARILTAHTADDRAETFFMNAIRGAGPAGLASIPRQRNRIVRPLLDSTHEQLCDYLRMRGIVWREDDTNADTRYLRAFVRHEVMPVVARRNAQVSSTLAATCDILSDEDAFLTKLAARTYRDLVRRSSTGMVALDAVRLAARDVALARRVVRRAILSVAPEARLEAHHIARTLELVAAGQGSASVALGVEVRVEYGLLFVRARRDLARPGQGPVAGPGGTAAWLEVPGSGAGRQMSLVDLGEDRVLTARLVEVAHGADPVELARSHGREWGEQSVLLDAAACQVDGALGGRLWVDAPAAGDVLCPLGMHGQSKKLSDLLNEAKIPAADRPQVPIVRTSPTGTIVWVAGIRADERSRCTPASRQLLELSLVNRADLPAAILAAHKDET